MHTRKTLLWALLLVLLTGCSSPDGDGPRVASGIDSLYTPEAAMRVYKDDPQRALIIIDSARLVGNVDKDLATMLKAKVYCQSTQVKQLDTAQRMLEGLMASDWVNDPSHREVVLDLLVGNTRLRDNYEQCLRWSTEKADLCRQQGKETEALRTEAEIGVLLVELGEEEEGLAKLNSVIARLDGQRQVNEMDACVVALRRKVYVLRKIGREEEVVPLAQHIIDILDDYREHYAQYEDNSYRLRTDKEEVERYCDYYGAQAYGYLAYVYAMESGKQKEDRRKRADAIKQARHYLELYEKSDYGKTLYGRQNIAPTWCLLGDYDKMLATYDELEAQQEDDTLSLDYTVRLRGRAIAAEARGQIAEACHYWKRYVEKKELFDKQLQESKAHEYAARYRLQEERLNTEREEAAKKRYGLVAILLGVLVLVVALFALLLVRQLLAIRKKNLVLTKEITDRIEAEERYMSLASSRERGAELPSPTYPLPAKLEELSDNELFEQLRRIILENELYLDPKFGRQQLMDRMHLSKESIGAAFSKGSQYASLASFVNEMRLVHGAKLLTEHPEMSIAEVAAASGFSSNVTFTRNFKERYALTPTEFRNKNFFTAKSGRFGGGVN